MNTVPTGVGIYGFGAAAQQYFGVPVSKLTVAQAAMIAAMPQAPDGYNPNPSGGAAYQNLVYRWHYVLNTMVQEGWLSQSQASAQKFPKLVKAFNNSWSGYRGYIMDAVQTELETPTTTPRAQIDNGGLRIVTTFSKPMMNELYASVKQEESLIHGGMPSWAHAGAVLEQPSTGEIWAMYGGPNFEDHGQEVREDPLPVEHGAAEPGTGRLLVQAVRAGAGPAAGHEREDQHAGRAFTAVDPAGRRPVDVRQLDPADRGQRAELVRGRQRRGRRAGQPGSAWSPRRPSR